MHNLLLLISCALPALMSVGFTLMAYIKQGHVTLGDWWFAGGVTVAATAAMVAMMPWNT